MKFGCIGFVFGIALASACSADAGEGPIGEDFAVSRTPVSATPCPKFAQVAQVHTISVRADGVLVDGLSATEPRVVPTDADPKNGDTPNVVFTTREAWTSPDGVAAPVISYRLWTHDDALTGTASAMFPFDTTTSATDCTFAWTVEGDRVEQ
jgi:hypothetical protein